MFLTDLFFSGNDVHFLQTSQFHGKRAIYKENCAVLYIALEGPVCHYRKQNTFIQCCNPEKTHDVQMSRISSSGSIGISVFRWDFFVFPGFPHCQAGDGGFGTWILITIPTCRDQVVINNRKLKRHGSSNSEGIANHKHSNLSSQSTNDSIIINNPSLNWTSKHQSLLLLMTQILLSSTPERLRRSLSWVESTRKHLRRLKWTKAPKCPPPKKKEVELKFP